MTDAIDWKARAEAAERCAGSLARELQSKLAEVRKLREAGEDALAFLTAISGDAQRLGIIEALRAAGAGDFKTPSPEKANDR